MSHVILATNFTTSLTSSLLSLSPSLTSSIVTALRLRYLLCYTQSGTATHTEYFWSWLFERVTHCPFISDFFPCIYKGSSVNGEFHGVRRMTTMLIGNIYCIGMCLGVVICTVQKSACANCGNSVTWL
jgi:hypothetical protein